MVGERFGRNNRLSGIVGNQPDYNNGSIAGGLAHVLQSYLQGRAINKDETDQVAANEALLRGLQGGGTTPDAGEMGPILPRPGGFDAAASELSGLAGNPYAGRLAQALALQQAGLTQQQAARDEQRAFEDQRYSQRTADQRAFTAEQNALNRQASAARANRPAQAPSTVQEWQYFSSLGPEDQQRYLAMKRNPQFLNLGDQMLRPDVLNPGQTVDARGVGVAPETKITDGQIITAPGVPGAVPAGFPGQGGQGGQVPQVGMQQGGLAPPQQQAQQPGGPLIQRLPPTPEQVRKQAETQRLANEKLAIVNQKFDQIQDSLESAWLPTTGLVGGQLLSNFGGTSAGNIAADLDTIKSIIGFRELQAMRDASPTGGALGQVSEMENRLLQAQLGSLLQSQTEDQFRRNLAGARDALGRIINEGISEQEAMARLIEMGQRGQGASQPLPSTQPSSPTPTQPSGWSIQRID